MSKKVLYTAIKPTGRITLGNYIGAVNNLKNYISDYNSIIAVANLHALTMNLDKEQLLSNTKHIFAFYLALGFDLNNTTFYLQSDVSEHAELSWVLSNFTGFGEASRMTQFKDYQAKNKAINAGLFTYPILMAADILLFNANIVPVGADQKQHVELTRNIAERFNNKFKNIFVVPEPMIAKDGAKIGGLLEPDKKMSKTDEGDNGVIFFEDSPEEVIKKVRRAVTDSENNIAYNPQTKPGVSNLLQIYATLKNITTSEAEKFFEGKNYGTLKQVVAETINETFAPIKKRYEEIINNEEFLLEQMKIGAQKAKKLAQKQMKKVYEAVGVPQNI